MAAAAEASLGGAVSPAMRTWLKNRFSRTTKSNRTPSSTAIPEGVLDSSWPSSLTMRIATIFGSSSTAPVTDLPGGACARVDAAPVRSASAKMPRHPLAQPDFMFPFAQTKGSTAALPALCALALSCNLAGAAAVPAGTVPFVDPALQEKYSRQMLFAGTGPAGQQRLLASRAAVVGCGAIGAAAANLLVRAGVGYLRIIDRD